MTTTTQSNAVFRNGIVFHVINVMNAISVFFAYCTSVIVSFSNHYLEGFIPLFWIKLSSSFSTLPMWRVLSNKKTYSANVRTKRVITSIGFRGFYLKGFSAIRTNTINSILPVNIVAFCRTKIIGRACANTPFTLFSAHQTFVFWLSAFPKSSSLSASHKLFASARVGTKTSLVFSSVYNLERLTAILTNFVNHIFHLNKERPACQWYCYLGNTGQTGRMKSIFTKPLIA